MHDDQEYETINFSYILEQRRKGCGDSLFLTWDSQCWSYSEAQDCIGQAAAMIRAAGIRKQVVAVWVKEAAAQLFLFLAVQKSGNIPILIHEYLHGNELEEFLSGHAVSILISDNREVFPAGGPVVSCGNDSFFMICRQIKPALSVPRGACMAVMTSGSTSVPKLFFRTAQSWAGFFPMQDKVFSITSKSCIFLQGSFGFTGNLNMALDVLCAGGEVTGTSSLRPSRWEQMIKEKEASHIYLIPSKLRLLARYFSSEMHFVTMILSGSQCMSGALVCSLYRIFPCSEVILYYGSTEMNYVSWIRGRDILLRPHAVGRIFPGIRAVVRGGGIFVKSPYTVCPADRFWTSGDAGHFDEDEFLIFEGRKQDIYNIKGNQVYKEKVLEALQEMPCCEEAEIMPFQSSNGEIRLEAFLTPKTLPKRDIMHFLENRLHPWEMPVRFFFLRELPRTSTGKIDYAMLRHIQEGVSFSV